MAVYFKAFQMQYDDSSLYIIRVRLNSKPRPDAHFANMNQLILGQ